MAHHDSHSHAHAADADHSKPSYDDINTPLIVMVGIISAIVTYLSVVVVQALTYQMDMNMIRERSHGAQYVKSIEAINNQKAKLDGDAESQRPSIEQAMTETVAQFSKQ